MEAADTPIPAVPSGWARLTGNGRVGGEGWQLEEKAAFACARSRAEAALMTEFLQAIEKRRPDAKVCTPGFAQKLTPLHEVVYDQLATPHGRGDAYMQTFLALLAAGLKSSDAAVRGISRSLGAQLAMEHASYHADDMEAA